MDLKGSADKGGGGELNVVPNNKCFIRIDHIIEGPKTDLKSFSIQIQYSSKVSR